MSAARYTRSEFDSICCATLISFFVILGCLVENGFVMRLALESKHTNENLVATTGKLYQMN